MEPPAEEEEDGGGGGLVRQFSEVEEGRERDGMFY